MPRKKKTESRKAPGLGATYQAAKLGVQVLALPANKAENLGFNQSGANAIVTIARGDFGPALWQGMGVAALDTVLSSKVTKHANALSRRSVTAMAPEIYASIIGARQAADTKKITGFSDGFTRVTTGYRPDQTTWDFGEAVPYMGLKYGGWVARRVIGRIPSVGTKVKKFLSMAGVTL